MLYIKTSCCQILIPEYFFAENFILDTFILITNHFVVFNDF